MKVEITENKIIIEFNKEKIFREVLKDKMNELKEISFIDNNDHEMAKEVFEELKKVPLAYQKVRPLKKIETKIGRPTIWDDNIEQFIMDNENITGRKLVEMIRKKFGSGVSASSIFKFKKDNNLGKRRPEKIPDYIICPICEKNDYLIRKGRTREGNQRYCCKDCKINLVDYSDKINVKTKKYIASKNNLPYSKEDERIIKEMNNDGYSNDLIAERLGRTKTAIAYKKCIMGINSTIPTPRSKRNEKHYKMYTNGENKTIYSLSKQGFSNEYIGKEIGRTASSVANRLSRLRKEGKQIPYGRSNFTDIRTKEKIIRRNWTPKEDQQLLDLLEKGYNITQIAKLLKRTFNSVLNRHKRLQLFGTTKKYVQ